MKKLLLIALLIVGCLFGREYIAVIDFEGIGISNDEAHDDISFKTRSISIGLFDETVNLISLRKDIPLNKSKNTLIVLGYGLGPGLLHAGIKYEPNYNNTGFSCMYSLGPSIDYQFNSYLEFSIMQLLGISYQYRFGESRNFANFGLVLSLSEDNWGPIISLTHYY